ncbi:MAG: ribose 5-phosphate isomerase B [Terriglobia bacterium]
MPDRVRIAVGSDHAGLALKEKVREYLLGRGYDVDDQGTHSEQSVDYPDFAEKVAERVAAGQATFGVVVCATGTATAMAANKVPGIRAAACNDTITARSAREHNNANVLTLGGRILGPAAAEKVLDTWLATPFAGGRHQKRLDKIAAIERSPKSIVES